MKKKLLSILTALVVLLPFALGLGSTLTAEAAGTVDITLHKKRFDTAQTAIQNTGEVMNEFASADGFGGVEFKIYNVTDDFYTLLNTTHPTASPARKYTMDEALTEVKSANYTAETPVDTGTTATTGSVGDLTFSALPDKTNGKNSVYVIVETAMAGVTKADNMVVALPLKGSDGTTDLTTIHLYPKNIVETAGVNVEKLSNLTDEDGDPIPLEDVEFVIHRKGLYNAAGTEYLSGFDGSDTPTWSTNLSDAHKFSTDGDGKFSEDRLLYGTYYLTEVTVKPGYVIQNGAIDQQFTLDATNTTKNFTGNDAILNDDVDVKKTNTGGSVNVGDKIDYRVETVIPTGIRDLIDSDGDGVNDAPRYVKYEITDTHGAHLELDDTTLSLTDGTTTFASPTHYTLDQTTTGVFKVSFTAAGIALLEPNATLVMTYKMELLQTIAPGDEVNNTAKVDTGHDTDEGSGSEVYTGGYNFVKVDGSNDGEALEGAKFVVRDADDASAKYLKIGTDGEVSWVTNEADATKYESDTSGYVTIKGLKDGTYYLEEVETPTDKYVLLTDRVEFEVTQGSFDSTDPLAATPGTPEEVVNKQKGSLPSTGGAGVYIMMALGVAVIAIVGAAYMRSQRKEA
ncbi:cell wall surface anchor protein [Enterococcus florum]|uniref:Cell wall surface anchor protein n=1 Tax=Enterococcus florum TaxID=2480627 RepID=A0A4P5PDY0_9ENTE|nr:SpaH/EbpB family LPXTG-anchored major pilin [Enterococcus florum]GCF93802.1 cell wall surface anchor protein [Enterococcus florum]